MRLDEMSYEEIKGFSEVLIPIGSIEQHGNHLPLGTDSIIATEICEELARREDTVISPTICFGFSKEHSSYPGTIDLGLDGFLSLIEKTVLSLDVCFDMIYLVNFHGGNSSALESLVKKMDLGNLYLIHFWRAMKEFMESSTEQEDLGIEHGGEFETSIMKFLRPELVKPWADLGPDSSLHIEGGRTYMSAWRSEHFTSVGSFGGAKWASEEKGKRLFESSICSLVEVLDEIRKPGS